MAAYAEAPFETYSWDDMFETMLAAMNQRLGHPSQRSMSP
jgi:hypothetical protein